MVETLMLDQVVARILNLVDPECSLWIDTIDDTYVTLRWAVPVGVPVPMVVETARVLTVARLASVCRGHGLTVWPVPESSGILIAALAPEV